MNKKYTPSKHMYGNSSITECYEVSVMVVKSHGKKYSRRNGDDQEVDILLFCKIRPCIHVCGCSLNLNLIGYV